MEQNVILIPLVLAVVGLVYMFIRASWVKRQSPGSERMQEISKAIKEGALAFLNACSISEEETPTSSLASLKAVSQKVISLGSFFPPCISWN